MGELLLAYALVWGSTGSLTECVDWSHWGLQQDEVSL